MSVTRKAFHLPPFISTSWAHVVSLHMEHEDHEQLLVVTLTNGAQICIPGLEERLLRHIFQMHAEVMENHPPSAVSSEVAVAVKESESARSVAARIPFTENGDLAVTMNGIEAWQAVGENHGGLLEGLSIDPSRLQSLEQDLLEHRPELTDSAPLPPLLLQRMSLMGRFLHPQLLAQMPRAEDGCGCPFCQLHRVLHGEPPDTALPAVAEVQDDELRFRSWLIEQQDDHVFVVSNPEDAQESYRVFLGDPLGCTCGHVRCEHVRAVLQSE
jgi:hypothetical protein